MSEQFQKDDRTIPALRRSQMCWECKRPAPDLQIDWWDENDYARTPARLHAGKCEKMFFMAGWRYREPRS
jgi:hypothetical protein